MGGKKNPLPSSTTKNHEEYPVPRSTQEEEQQQGGTKRNEERRLQQGADGRDTNEGLGNVYRPKHLKVLKPRQHSK